MNAKELRIDNYLLFKDKVVKVEAITKETISVSGFEQNRFTPVYLDNINLKPIELTEEILLKCGFIEDDFNKKGYLYLKTSSICIDGHIDYLYIKKNSNSVKLRSTRSIQIKHLHQLQNLYFALTGEELQINL